MLATPGDSCFCTGIIHLNMEHLVPVRNEHHRSSHGQGVDVLLVPHNNSSKGHMVQVRYHGAAIKKGPVRLPPARLGCDEISICRHAVVLMLLGCRERFPAFGVRLDSVRVGLPRTSNVKQRAIPKIGPLSSPCITTETCDFIRCSKFTHLKITRFFSFHLGHVSNSQ